MADEKPKVEEEDPFVDAVILGYTSVGGHFYQPGPAKLRKSVAKGLQGQGLARPPQKVVMAIPASELPASEEGDDEE